MSVSSWIEKAQKIGAALAPLAAQHDRDGTFVAEGYTALKREGMFKALVPAELGGMGAGIRDICEFIRELATCCSSTALAYSMHSHLAAATVWRHKHGQPGKALLEKLVNPGLILVSTGANDWLESNGVMEKVAGGYRYKSMKPFASGSPMGDLLITSGRYDDPQAGPHVLHFSLPLSAEGVSRGSDWDTHGMRGTGSDTVKIDGAFVPEESVSMRRPLGPWAPALNVVVTVALPIVMSAYVGLTEHAVSLALGSAKKRRDDLNVQYLAGEIQDELFQVRALWNALIANANEFDFVADLEHATLGAQGKTMLATACVRTVEKAMELGGGGAFFRSGTIERLMRDVRGGIYHPIQAKRQHSFTGRIALGLEPV